MKLMKDWYSDGRGYERERDAIGTLETWYRKNLVIDRGSGRNIEEKLGMAYTSSSDFAAIWNVNGKAHYCMNPQMDFDGVALTEKGHFIAVFTVYDFEGNEVGEAYVYMN